ncbi:MAG: hypothetical protein HYV13_03600 [Candidatus Doudnabacteria bacterium]|nr:hypothetical protein [Candidatus Doudnabacteria bacterium]
MTNKAAAITVLTILSIMGIYLIYPHKNSPNKSPAVIEGGLEEIEADAGRTLGSVKSEELGAYLTDYEGMTVYVFADDKKLESTCYDECLENWTPYKWDPTQNFESLTHPLDKKANAVTRSDGTRQYAFGIQPLYYYQGDKIPGDVNGNGLDNGKWGIVPITE